MAFVMLLEEGPELDRMVNAIAGVFEIDGDITSVVQAMAQAFGVPAQTGWVDGADYRAVLSLLGSGSPFPLCPAQELLQQVLAEVETQRAG